MLSDQICLHLIPVHFQVALLASGDTYMYPAYVTLFRGNIDDF